MTKRWAPVAQMTGLAAVGLAVAAGLTGSSFQPELALGVLGPLAGSAVSWLLMERAAASGGQTRLLAFMTRAMAAKMVLFPLYVIGLVFLLNQRPVPFAGAFAAAFIVFYTVQALHLKRLVAANLSEMGVPGQ